jgi:hypothetical protein
LNQIALEMKERKGKGIKGKKGKEKTGNGF